MSELNINEKPSMEELRSQLSYYTENLKELKAELEVLPARIEICEDEIVRIQKEIDDYK